MSRILVVGTSHSDGSCKKEDGTERIAIKDRWQHHIGHEVETLARSGATSQQQFYALWNFLLDNPNATWDYVIIEGRHINSVDGSYPKPSSKNIDITKFDGDDNHNDFYNFWQCDDPETNIRKQLFAFSSMQNYRDTNWYVEYAMSPLHWVDNYTCIHSMCKLLEEKCKDLLFIAWSWNKHDAVNKQILWAGKLLEKYIDETVWPALATREAMPNLNEEVECLCGHWNETGQKIIADKVKEIISRRGWK